MPISKQIMSFVYALRGIADAISTQKHMRFHLVAAAGVLLSGLGFGLKSWEWVALFLTIGCVWMAELLNTAIEYIVDLASPEYHILAGKAKDAAAGAVLCIAIAACGVALVIFGKRLLHLFMELLV